MPREFKVTKHPVMLPVTGIVRAALIIVTMATTAELVKVRISYEQGRFLCVGPSEQNYNEN